MKTTGTSYLEKWENAYLQIEKINSSHAQLIKTFIKDLKKIVKEPDSVLIRGSAYTIDNLVKMYDDYIVLMGQYAEMCERAQGFELKLTIAQGKIETIGVLVKEMLGKK